MTLNEFKKELLQGRSLQFELPGGNFVAAHFHITEIGKVNKDFIDCGGTVRKQSFAEFQLWTASDFAHRLTAEKLIGIIQQGEKLFGLTNETIKFQVQGSTIELYGLELSQGHFKLTPTLTACLALDACGIEDLPKRKINLADLSADANCTPGGGCC